MMQFTERAADRLAASITLEMSPRTESEWASRSLPGLFAYFTMEFPFGDRRTSSRPKFRRNLQSRTPRLPVLF